MRNKERPQLQRQMIITEIIQNEEMAELWHRLGSQLKKKKTHIGKYRKNIENIEKIQKEYQNFDSTCLQRLGLSCIFF